MSDAEGTPATQGQEPDIEPAKPVDEHSTGARAGGGGRGSGSPGDAQADSEKPVDPPPAGGGEG
jgi:hypothetical protein